MFRVASLNREDFPLGLTDQARDVFAPDLPISREKTLDELHRDAVGICADVQANMLRELEVMVDLLPQMQILNEANKAGHLDEAGQAVLVEAAQALSRIQDSLVEQKEALDGLKDKLTAQGFDAEACDASAYEPFVR